MTKGDIRRDDKQIWTDCLAAIGLLTRLPVPLNAQAATDRGAASAWAYPVAGAVVGLLSAVMATVAMGVGLSLTLAAAIVVATQIVLTGAMHEDGLADSADGLWGGWTVERRLAIMKDSHIGTYGVLALVIAVLVRWLAISALLASAHPELALIALGALSRAPMAALMGWMPAARPTGLSKSVGAPDTHTIRVGLGVAGVIGMVCLGWWIIPVAIVGGLAALGCAVIALAKIDGQTGDILGATQQVTEIAVLLTLVALI